MQDIQIGHSWVFVQITCIVIIAPEMDSPVAMYV